MQRGEQRVKNWLIGLCRRLPRRLLPPARAWGRRTENRLGDDASPQDQVLETRTNREHVPKSN